MLNWNKNSLLKTQWLEYLFKLYIEITYMTNHIFSKVSLYSFIFFCFIVTLDWMFTTNQMCILFLVSPIVMWYHLSCISCNQFTFEFCAVSISNFGYSHILTYIVFSRLLTFDRLLWFILPLCKILVLLSFLETFLINSYQSHLALFGIYFYCIWNRTIPSSLYWHFVTSAD